MGMAVRVIFGVFGLALLGLYIWGVRIAPPKGEPYPIAKRIVRVEAPPKEVFDYVVDLRNLRKYVPGLVTLKENDERAELDVGTRTTADIVVPVLGRSDDVAITVVDFHPSAFLRFKMDLPPLMPIYTMSFIEGRDGGTDVEWVAESRNHTGWFGGVVLPMTRLIWQYREDQMVEQFATAFGRRQPPQEYVEEKVSDLIQ